VRGNNEKALIDDGHTVVPIVYKRVFFIVPGSSKFLIVKAFKNSVTDTRKKQSSSKRAAVYLWWLTATRNSI
jgi:hypothetical protein